MLKIRKSETKSLDHYLAKVRKLLTKDPGVIVKGILPTVFDIYSYPHDPEAKVSLTKAKRS